MNKLFTTGNKKIALYTLISFVFVASGTFAQTFSTTNIGSLPKNFEREMLWVDVDNDGDSDLLIGGSVSQPAIYKNTNGFFSFYTSTNFPFLLHPNFGAADFNKDGFVDLVMTGTIDG